MKKINLKIAIKTTFFLILLGAIYIFFRFLSSFISTSEYFDIRTVTVNDKGIDLSYLKGRNIFTLDLSREAQRISAMYPNCQRIRLVRQLPNCIRIDLQKRQAVAYVSLYRYFAVNKEAVLFNLDKNDIVNPNLPLILGLETKIFGPKAGRRYHDVKELTLCLDLIKGISSIRELKDYRVKKIDVSTLATLSFYILDNIEIKIGPDNINRKLRLLNSLLTSLRSDLSRIKYIDLRFKQPVIKYKNEK